MTDAWEAETLFDVLERETARRILALTAVESLSAQELAARTEESEPTIYRRLDVLEEFDLLEEVTRIDEDGNHYTEYETNLASVTFELEDGGFTIDVTYRRDLVD